MGEGEARCQPMRRCYQPLGSISCCRDLASSTTFQAITFAQSRYIYNRYSLRPVYIAAILADYLGPRTALDNHTFHLNPMGRSLSILSLLRCTTQFDTRRIQKVRRAWRFHGLIWALVAGRAFTGIVFGRYFQPLQLKASADQSPCSLEVFALTAKNVSCLQQ